MESEKIREKKSKKNIVIEVIITLLVLVTAAIGGYFIYQNTEGKRGSAIGSDWGDTYYEFITSEAGKESGAIINNANEYELQFIDVEENETPVMTMKSIKKEKDNTEGIYLGIYYIDENQSVRGYVQTAKKETQNLDVNLLYNRKEEKYKWYMKLEDSDKTTYTDIEKNIDSYKEIDRHEDSGNYIQSEEYNKLQENMNFTFNNNEMPTEKIEDTTDISKFEETFIIPDNVEESEAIKLTDITNTETVKQEMTEAVNGYQSEQEILTEKVKQSVTDKTTNIINRENAIKEAEEKAKKEAEEKAKKEAEEKAKTEEEAKNGIKAGSYTLKYGTYKNNWGDVLTIKTNGTYVGNSSIYGKHSGKYKVFYYKGYKDEMETEPAGWLIKFTPTSGSSTSESFYIKGNNKFSALQYDNTFTWRSSN